MWTTLYIVLLWNIFVTTKSEELSDELQKRKDPCESHDTCNKCITNPNCVWCAKSHESFQGSRCKSSSPDVQSQCPDNLQDMHSTVTITQNKDFTSSNDIVQIKPQNIQIKLRVGELTHFSFKYKPAENYPVDLYFLLDVTLSMQRISNKLMQQSQDIFETMRNFTNKIRLGIGTFIDKNTLPYVRYPQKNECYSFRNQLPLTNNVSKFNQVLKDTTFFENFDDPEGGLDGLAQVLACSSGTDNIIEWSPHSRKIVLFITDGPYHATGDGIQSGINQPYDGKCYTSSDGVYTKELEMDYPSVSMINKLATKTAATILFVASKDIGSIYQDLANAITGARFQEFSLQAQAENKADFRKIIKEVYENKMNTITLIKSIKEVAYGLDAGDLVFTDCDNDECMVKILEEITINGTIELNKYVDSIKKFAVEIAIDGLNEKLTLEVEVLNNCECENDPIKDAVQCNKKGILQCGLCTCDENWFGPQCNCTKNYHVTDSASCKRKGDDRVCSGNGQCLCGECVCDSNGPGKEEKYTGAYCQCNSQSCPRRNNIICSGHGNCNCGVCECDTLWTGNACDISKLKTGCVKDGAPVQECSGRGRCFNNTCQCNELPEWDARRNSLDVLCDIKPEANAHNRQCKVLEEHAICAHQRKNSCPKLESVVVNQTKEITEADRSLWKICEDVRVGVGCYIQFGYKYYDNNQTIQILVAEKEDCQQTYYMYGGIVFATLILGGIGTLVGWKVLTTIRDRREYAELLANSRHQTSVRRNVIYTSPNTTINNPTYVESKDL